MPIHSQMHEKDRSFLEKVCRMLEKEKWISLLESSICELEW